VPSILSGCRKNDADAGRRDCQRLRRIYNHADVFANDVVVVGNPQAQLIFKDALQVAQFA